MDVRWSENPEAVLGRLAQAVRRGLGRGLDSWARTTSNTLRKAAERPYRNGISGKADAQKLQAVVESVEPVGMYREYGTGLYGPRKKRIEPKGRSYVGIRGRRARRRMLRWVSDGNEIFARSVKGAPPRPWFWVTVRARLKLLNAELIKAVGKSVERAAKRAGM